MRCLLVTWFSNIAVPAAGRGVEVSPHHFLTADSAFVARLLRPEFGTLAGRLAIDELLASSAVFYAAPSLPSPLKPDEITSLLESFLRLANLISMAMWFVKDNAAMSSEGYYQLHQTGPRTGTYVTRHSTGIYYWDATAEKKLVRFTADELRQARGYLHELPSRLGLPEGPILAAPTLPNDIPRLGRAWYMLENARMTPDLATRVATYVTCFEALFATATQELAHILSERVAFFLGTTSAERRTLFTSTKAAYGIRSKVLHGDELPKKQREALPGVVKTCDDLVRRAFLKILGSAELVATFNGKKDHLDEYFTNAIFDPSGSAA